MEFRAALKPSLKPSTLVAGKASIYPQAIVAQRLLSLPLFALRQELQGEAEENPALELTEEWRESAEGQEASSCPTRPKPASWAETEQEAAVAAIPARTSLQQYLWESLALEVPDSRTRRIAHYLIQNINDDGYLGCEVEEVALHFGAERERVEEALQLVQGLEPAGVGARDLRECLLIQIGRLKGCEMQPLAEKILREHWKEFGRRRFGLIARGAKICLQQVQEAVDFIRARLCPYPGRGFHLPWQPNEAPELPHPDVIVRQNSGWEIEVAEDTLSCVRLSPTYLEVYRQMCSNGVCYTQQERKHVFDRVRRARLFLEALEQRQRTLKRITSLIVSLEEGFFNQGAPGFVPLRRSDLARRLGISLSTVSRALGHKYLLVPGGEVISFGVFFDSSLLAKEMIRRLLEQEHQGKPLSDGEIASRLAGEGINLARRTVAKYREELKIFSRSKRSRKD